MRTFNFHTEHVTGYFNYVTFGTGYKIIVLEYSVESPDDKPIDAESFIIGSLAALRPGAKIEVEFEKDANVWS